MSLEAPSAPQPQWPRLRVSWEQLDNRQRSDLPFHAQTFTGHRYVHAWSDTPDGAARELAAAVKMVQEWTGGVDFKLTEGYGLVEVSE